MKKTQTKTAKVVVGSKPVSYRRKLKKTPHDGRRAKPRMKTIKVSPTFKGRS